MSGCVPSAKNWTNKKARKKTKKNRHRFRTIQFQIPPKKNPNLNPQRRRFMNIPTPILPKPSPRESNFRAARQTETKMPELSRSTFLHRRQREQSTAVTFSPLAWLKLLMFLHADDTEVGGFGISAEKQPLYIEDFVTVKQSVTAVTVAFDDTAVADFFDVCIDRGLTPARFARVWVHTHPGESPEPSSVDEETFARVFGSCDWVGMLIVSRTHATYARVSFSAGPGGSILLPV